jgi:hypothetical protein
MVLDFASEADAIRQAFEPYEIQGRLIGFGVYTMLRRARFFQTRVNEDARVARTSSRLDGSAPQYPPAWMRCP